MESEALLPVFDGHNDVLLRLYTERLSFFTRDTAGHLDLPRAREGGFAGGFFAAFVPSISGEDSTGTPEEKSRAYFARFQDEQYMPPTPSLEAAQRMTLGVMALLFRIEAESGGQVKVVRGAADLAACLREGVIAAILHIEGAEAIDEDLDALDVFYQAGLRSLGPVWSRPNRFGHGTPFRFPSSPDIGPGLTDAGRALIRACNRLRIMVDLSHLNEQGFWEVAELSDAPLVATHSNAWSLCHSARNLTDKQLDSIRDSQGMVGVNYHTSFLRADGVVSSDTPLDVLVDHIDYLVDRLGIDSVGLGSDFDGAVIPEELHDVAGLPKLVALLRRRGYDQAALKKLTHQNWLRVLARTWDR
jgi:membrane dipeptidase